MSLSGSETAQTDGGADAEGSLCPICRSQTLRRDATTERVQIVRCPGCGHRVARHCSTDVTPSGDYHGQYDQSGFLSALERTRLRQGRLIVRLLQRQLAEPFSLFDFGAGRGWFLSEARRAGLTRLAGADTSQLAVSLLRGRGFEALQLAAEPSDAALPTLTFRPDVVTFLDVVEHFRASEVAAKVAQVLAHFRPRFVVIKVPVSSGLLHRSARALASCGKASALEQLYQVGTFPPHFSYFSRPSLALLLKACRLELLDEALDLDFEAEDLARRARALDKWGMAARGLGVVASVAARSLGCEDSLIAVARFNAPAQS